MLEFTVVVAKLGSEFESHEHMGDFKIFWGEKNM